MRTVRDATRKFLIRFQSRSAAPAAAAPSPAEEPDVGLKDAALSGWLRTAQGELLEGFPIVADDVVLDLGCGEGHFAAFCGERATQVILVDVDAATLAAAEARVKQTGVLSVRALQSDTYPLSIAAGSVSKIILTEVLEHVDNPADVMREVVRVGQPGALYLISVPDPVHEHLQKQGISAPAHFQKPNHIRIFEREQFKDLVQQSGLIIERETSYGFFWAMWWLFFWSCKQDLSPPWHPLLAAWNKTWWELLSTEQGPHVKKVLDQFMPKSQVIIARKPG
jgi:ubiquinone/menaquinone biosynthesis C-methylase UbiE